MLSTALLFASFSLLNRFASSSFTIGQSVSYSNGILASVATMKSNAAPGLRDDAADKFSDDFTAGALWVNDTRSEGDGWGIRFGFEDKNTTPSAVVVLWDAVYVSAKLSDSPPVIYKYDINKKSRTFVRSIGDATDEIGLFDGRERTDACDELMVVVKLGKKSSLISAEKRTNNADLILLTLDACTGNNAEDPLVLDSFEPTEGITSTEFPADIAMSPDGTSVYVATATVRVGPIIQVVPAIHRVDAVEQKQVLAKLPVTDALNVRVHAESDCLFVAVGSHPGNVGADKDNSAVLLFRRNPETLESLEWGADKKTSAIDPAFTITLPLRQDAAQLTKVVDVSFLPASREAVLLLTTLENSATWDAVKDTKPPSSPAIRIMRTTARQELLSKLQSVFIFVSEDATISKRTDGLLGNAATILPQVPLPSAGDLVTPARMKVDGDSDKAFIIGTNDEISPKSLFYAEIKLSGRNTSASPSPSPTAKKKVCIGASTTTFNGEKVTDLVANHPKLRMQVHPKLWLDRVYCGVVTHMKLAPWSACHKKSESSKEVPMLCYSWRSGTGRLCATEGHILKYNNKLVYMRDFCSVQSNKCVETQQIPWNFKGPCDLHVAIADNILLTQHAGDPDDELADQVARKECELRAISRAEWTLNTL